MWVYVPETNNKNYHSRQTYDIEEIMKLTASIIENCPIPIKSKRLGKYVPGKNRQLKVFFSNSKKSKLLLRNKTKLQESIKFYSDQTPAQNKYLQSVMEELNKRLENGEKDLIIKYFKGIPQIVDNGTSQKN